MKTLKEQVDEVMNSKCSKRAKSITLIKLGLMPHEIKMLLGTISVESGCRFNANLLTFGVEIECFNVIRESLIREVEHRMISIKSEGYNHTDNSTYYKITRWRN